MFADVSQLCCPKTEHTEQTCEDAYDINVSEGLFVVADGAGTTIFSDAWARLLVKHFLSVPLMSDYPFEVEWWVRLAQDEYKKQEPDPTKLAWNAQQKAQNQGSAATLATLRISQVGKTSAKGDLLVFGDSCVFVGKPNLGEIKVAFPLEKATDFERAPVCIPSKLTVFNRYFHQCHIKQIDLEAKDIVILATDAVSKWILSAGGGHHKTNWDAFDEIVRQTPDSWKAFIEGCRDKKEMIDDDSTAIRIVLQEDEDSVDQLGSTSTHRQSIVEERKKAFKQARDDDNKELMAIYFGGGEDLSSLGVNPGEIEKARGVADALREVMTVLRETLNNPNFSMKMQPVWDRNAELLLYEKCAENLRRTLVQKGVNLTSAQPKLVSLLPPKTNQTTPPMSPPALPSKPQPSIDVIAMESKKLGLERRFLDAYRADKDEAILAVYADIQRFPYPQTIVFSQAELDRISLAQQHKATVKEARDALSSKDAQQMANAYQPIQKDLQALAQAFHKDELEQLDLALRFIVAYRAGDDEAILAAYNDIQQPARYGFLLFTLQERQRIDLAQKGVEALRRFQAALKSRRPELIDSEYDPILEHNKSLREEELDQLRLAQSFMKAYKADDDEGIVVTLKLAERFQYGGFFVFTPQEQQRIALAQKRRSVHKALNSKNAQQMADAYIALQGDFGDLSNGELEQLKFAQRFVGAYHSNNDEAISAICNELQTPVYRNLLILTPEEQERIESAWRRNAVRSEKPFLEVAEHAPTINPNQLRRVASVKEMYRYYRRKEPISPEQLEQIAQEDIVNVPYIQKGLEILNHGPGPKVPDSQSMLTTVLVHFKNFFGDQYLPLLNQHQITEQQLEETLLICIQQELLAEHLQSQKPPIQLEDWLTAWKRDGRPPELKAPEELPADTTAQTIVRRKITIKERFGLGKDHPRKED